MANGLIDILSILDSSVVGYIHVLSTVKSGCKNSNITYWGMIEAPDVTYSKVSS